MTTHVPVFPLIHVALNDDGSAHLNVTGRHVDFPAAPAEETRAAVILYAAKVAAGLHRPVRMTTSGPDGTWLIAVAPDQTVIDLSPAAAPKKPLRLITPRQAHSGTRPATDFQPTAVIEPLEPWTPLLAMARPAPTETQLVAQPAPSVVETKRVEPLMLDDSLEETRIVAPPAPRPAADLMFSTGDSATVDGRVVIGRNPLNGDAPAQLIALADPTRTISKTHCALHWEDGTLFITDLGSANGTTVFSSVGTTQLTAGLPEAIDSDVRIQMGEQYFTVALPPTA